MNLVTSNEGVTNSSLSEEQIGIDVDSLRVRMIDEQDKNGLFRAPFIGYTQRMELTVVKPTKTARPHITLPKMVSKRDGMPACSYIGGLDGVSPYQVISGNHIVNINQAMYTKGMPYAYYDGEKVFFYNVTPEKVMVNCVFEDPGELEVLGFYNAEISNYPMPIGMIDQLIGKTANSYLNTMYRIVAQPNTQSDIPVNARPRGK